MVKRTRIHSLMAAALLMSIMLTASPVMADQCPSPLGDVTDDGKTDIMDIQCTILCALADLVAGTTVWPDCMAVGSSLANHDCLGEVTVTDVSMVIFWALKLPLSTSVDYNGNGCVDTCETVCIGPDCPFRLDQGAFTGFGGTVHGSSKKLVGHGDWLQGKTEDGPSTLEVGVKP